MPNIGFAAVPSCFSLANIDRNGENPPMSFRVRAIAILFFLGLTFAGGLGLAAMTGGLSALMSGNLKA